MRGSRWGSGTDLATQLRIQRGLDMLAGLGGGGGRRLPPSGPPTGAGEWECGHADCRFAQKGMLNYADRRFCGGCARPKSKAMSPPTTSAVKGAASQSKPEEPETLAAQQAKQAASGKNNEARRLRKAKGLGKPSAPAAPPKQEEQRKNAAEDAGPVAQAFTANLFLQAGSATAPALTRAALPEELTEQAPLLAGVVKAVASSLGQDTLPLNTAPKKAELVVDEFLGNKDPVKKEERKKEQAAVVTRLKVVVASIFDGGEATKEFLVPAQEKLKTAERDLSKLEKDSLATGYDVKAVANAKTSFELALQRKRGHMQDGNERAQERIALRAKIFQDARDQLDLLENGTKEVEKQCADAHAERAAAAALVDAEVLRLFDSKIAKGNEDDAAAKAAKAAKASGPKEDAGPEAGDGMTDVTDPLAKAQQDARRAQEALEAAQRAHTAALKQQEETQRKALEAAEAARAPPHLARFTCDQADLPTLGGTPDGQQWLELHYLWAGLEALQRQEALQGFQVPVTFGQLQAGLKVPALLLGEALWKKAFPLFAEPPTLDTVVTVQVRMLLQLSMETHRAALCAQEANRQAAKEKVRASVSEAVSDYRAKRRRTGQGDADA